MLKKISLVAAAAITLAACGAYVLKDNEKTTAELGARDYADRVNASYVSCSAQDSDNDSYVTCSIQPRDNKSAPIKELLCSYRNNVRGCKSK